MSSEFQYPPDLFHLLVDTISVVCRSKHDVILFFKGAGVPPTLTNDLVSKVNKDKDSIKKYEIARTVLTRLNERGDSTLMQRREVLKRVVEFENFSSCWASDQLKAKGLVAEVRQLVNVRDSFTRMSQERDEERKIRLADQKAKQEEAQKRRATLAEVKAALFSLFSETNSHKRGKALEGVLNRLFEAEGILVHEAFAITGTEGEGIVEQIDGVIELDGSVYLVEMKWWNEPLGLGDVAQHQVRVFSRGHARGIFISNSGYTQAAENSCREALQKSVFVLCKLEEFVTLLEQEANLKEFLKAKINAAITHKNPLHEPLKHWV